MPEPCYAAVFSLNLCLYRCKK